MAESYIGLMARRRHLNLVATSAGILEGERPVSTDAIEVIGRDGLDMSGHISRLLEVHELRRSDLVVGMAREHVREAVLLEPSSWPHTFTLKEIVRRGEATGRRSPQQSLSDWLAKVGSGRHREDLMGWSPADDVEDPMDKGPVAYRATGKEIHNLVTRLLALIEPGR